MDLGELLKENPNVTVVIASKVCVKKGMVMRKEFVDSLQVWLKLFLAWITLITLITLEPGSGTLGVIFSYLWKGRIRIL